MAKRTYLISHLPLDWECKIEIDEDRVIEYRDAGPYTCKDVIKDLVEFWAYWKEDLKRNKGDYTKTLLQKMGRKILFMVAGHDLNLGGVLNLFKDQEGWVPMNGEYGIKILSVDEFEFALDEFEVEEIKNRKG